MWWCIFIYSCFARLISFEMNLKTTDFSPTTALIKNVSVSNVVFVFEKLRFH